MTALEERFERGREMRAVMAAGDPSHFTLPGIDLLAPVKSGGLTGSRTESAAIFPIPHYPPACAIMPPGRAIRPHTARYTAGLG